MNDHIVNDFMNKVQTKAKPSFRIQTLIGDDDNVEGEENGRRTTHQVQMRKCCSFKVKDILGSQIAVESKGSEEKQNCSNVEQGIPSISSSKSSLINSVEIQKPKNIVNITNQEESLSVMLAEVNENRPPTPLTPSLDPKLLKKFEEEDRPKRVLRASTIAATRNSNLNAIKVKTNRRTGSFSTSFRRIVDNVKQNTTKNLRKASIKDNESAVTYNTQLEIKIDEDCEVCTPSTSGVSSISSTSSNGNFSRHTKRKKKGKGADLLTTTIISNWQPTGEGFRRPIYLRNDTMPVKRICFKEVRHRYEPEILRIGDSVIVKSDNSTTNLGRINRIYLDAQTGSLMATVVWYYKPDQIELDHNSVQPAIDCKELFASRHIDSIPLESVEEIIFVTTFNEYVRYMTENKIDSLPRAQCPTEEDEIWPRGEVDYPRRKFLPCEDTPVELVYFCRRLYDFKNKKLIFGTYNVKMAEPQRRHATY